MEDKTNSYFGAELTPADLENVAGGMKEEHKKDLIKAARDARDSGYTKKDFIKEVLGLDYFSEDDYDAWGTTREEMLKTIEKAWNSY